MLMSGTRVCRCFLKMDVLRTTVSEEQFGDS